MLGGEELFETGDTHTAHLGMDARVGCAATNAWTMVR